MFAGSVKRHHSVSGGGGSAAPNAEAKTSKNEDESQKSVDKKVKRDYNEINALGENKFVQGFSEKNLNEHWGGASDHSDKYPGFTKEQYAARALELVQSAADGKRVLGYKMSDGSIVRYDTKENDFVKGHPDYGIYTMFKPKNKSQYFHKRKKGDGGLENDNSQFFVSCVR